MGRASKRKDERPRAERVAKRTQQDAQTITVRRWAAYHEAAHALVGLAVGHDVSFTEIYSDGGGFTKPASPAWFKKLSGTPMQGLVLSAEQRTYVYGRLVSTVAAMDIEHGLKQVMGFDIPQAHDMDLRASAGWARLLAAQEGCLEGAQALLHRAAHDAHTVLGANANALVALAEALYQRGRLSGEEIRQQITITPFKGGDRP